LGGGQLEQLQQRRDKILGRPHVHRSTDRLLLDHARLLGALCGDDWDAGHQALE
jgi:hypothetical protein